MKHTVFNMENNIEAVDPMVVMLKAAVENILVKEKLMLFQISVSEALTNAVEHAKTDGREAPTEIHLVFETQGASIVIFDQDGAPPFDPREHSTDLSIVDTTAETGRGLGLILHCADRVEYDEINGRKGIRMIFHNAT